MEEDKIVLDRKSFEALAVDSRVRILKSLKKRRKTLSELAEEQKMSVSGVKEHLENLEKVGLIEKKDDGHKWKYYELTKKGSEIIGPREIRVWILLVTSMLALVASLTAMMSPPVEMLQMDAKASDQIMINSENESQPLMATGPAMAVRYAEPESAIPEPPKPDLTVPMIVGVVSSLTLIGCVLILIKNRTKYPRN